MPAVFTKPYAYDLGTSLREKSLILGKTITNITQVIWVYLRFSQSPIHQDLGTSLRKKSLYSGYIIAVTGLGKNTQHLQCIKIGHDSCDKLVASHELRVSRFTFTET
jgi:hypothetical protein